MCKLFGARNFEFSIWVLSLGVEKDSVSNAFFYTVFVWRYTYIYADAHARFWTTSKQRGIRAVSSTVSLSFRSDGSWILNRWKSCVTAVDLFSSKYLARHLRKSNGFCEHLWMTNRYYIGKIIFTFPLRRRKVQQISRHQIGHMCFSSILGIKILLELRVESKEILGRHVLATIQADQPYSIWGLRNLYWDVDVLFWEQ